MSLDEEILAEQRLGERQEVMLYNMSLRQTSQRAAGGREGTIGISTNSMPKSLRRWGRDVRFLVDTHIALWTLLDPDRLSAQARAALSDPSTYAAVSYASVWEVAIKHAARPDRMPIPSASFVEKCRVSGFDLLAIEVEHISETESIRLVVEGVEHRDSFDRLLVAQAHYEHLKFMTHDSKLAASGDPCIFAV